jgi:hypothetical protein
MRTKPAYYDYQGLQEIVPLIENGLSEKGLDFLPDWGFLGRFSA